MTKPNLDKDKKKQIIDDILQSADFAKSKKYQKLISYLAEASIKGETVKASTLAYDFFGKEASFDPSVDSTVRSYISNLRKKLEHYYLTEGENKEYRIVIPKGNYHIEFEENIHEHTVTIKEKKSQRIYLAIIIALLLLSSYLLYNLLSGKQYNMDTFDTTLWKGFLNSNKETLFVIGDYFVFQNNLAEGRKSYVRDIQINSISDLNKFLDKYPKYKQTIKKTSNSYLDESTPFCLAEILPFFILKNIKYKIKLSSDLQLEDIQKNNIIYIGSHKSLNLLNLFTNNLNFKYKILPGGITYYDNQNDSSYMYSIEDNFSSLARRDFPIVIKETGPNNNSFLFFISIHDLGNISTVKYFTKKNNVKIFFEKIKTNNFIALFETRGYRREDFSIKLLHVKKLPKKLELPVIKAKH